jgi:hypothetical protein
MPNQNICELEEKLHFAEEKLHFAEERLHFAEEKLHFAEKKLHLAEEKLLEFQKNQSIEREKKNKKFLSQNS